MFNLNYKITNKIINHLTEIAIARDIIEKARLIPKWELSLRRDALIHSAYSSTHIEGNRLTLEEVSQLALGREVSAIRKDKQELLNYLGVLSNLKQYGPRNILTPVGILKIHKDLVHKTLNLEKDEGAYRDRQVVVGYNNPDGSIVVTFRPPPTKDVPKLVSGFAEWLNFSETKTINSVLIGGIAHYEIVRIHPFIDGNGRCARVVASLIMLMHGFDTKRFFALDDYYDSDRQSYYSALKSVDPKTVNTTKWLEYFCEGVAYSVNRVKEKVLKISKDNHRTRSLEQVSLTNRQMKIVEELTRHGKITNKDLQTLFKISPQAIHKEMKKMMKQNVIMLIGKGRNAYYELV